MSLGDLHGARQSLLCNAAAFESHHLIPSIAKKRTQCNGSCDDVMLPELLCTDPHDRGE